MRKSRLARGHHYAPAGGTRHCVYRNSRLPLARSRKRHSRRSSVRPILPRRLGINRASVYRALGLTPTVVRRYCTTQRSCAPRSASTSASKPPASDALSPVPEPVGTIGGRQLASGSRRGSSSGKSCSNTGPSVRSSNLRAVSKTRRWNTGSMGGPKGRPSSNGTHSARGGRVFSVCGRIRLIETVARPSSSR